jgi:hypothetical protein
MQPSLEWLWPAYRFLVHPTAVKREFTSSRGTRSGSTACGKRVGFCVWWPFASEFLAPLAALGRSPANRPCAPLPAPDNPTRKPGHGDCILPE